MSCFIYCKLSFEKDYQRIQIDDNLFFENKISFEDLEDYLQYNFYMTPVQILQKSVSDEQFIYNYSSIVLQLKERFLEKILNFVFENNSYELILRLPKNKSTFKVKFLLNLIRKKLKIDSRIYISTLNQNQFQLEDSVSVLETIFVSLQSFNSSPIKQIAQQDNYSIPFDQISEASTSDQSLSESKERSSDTFIDLLFNPQYFNSTKDNNFQCLNNINNQDKICVENNLFVNESVINTQQNQSSDFLKNLSYSSELNSTQTNNQQYVNNFQNKMHICVENNIYNGIPLVSNKKNLFKVPPKPQNQSHRTSNPFLKKQDFFNSSIRNKSFLNNSSKGESEIQKVVCVPIKKSIAKQF